MRARVGASAFTAPHASTWRTRPQVKLKLDYAGGWGKYRRDYWRGFDNACSAYDGPKLGWFVGGCKAPDGSYWALQAWQKMLPNYGLAPNPTQSAWELHLSHWSGALPQFNVKLDWAYRQFQHLYGTFSYGGSGVFGFSATRGGNPLDSFGRNVYLDSWNSDYVDGKGTWMRVNSWLTHKNTGAWCYGVSPHGSANKTGTGAEYRLTIIGPGVTPDVSVTVTSPGAYNPTLDAAQNQKIAALNDKLCRPN